MMVLSAIAKLLSQTIGLDPDTIGNQRIARAAETRRVGCKLPDIESYWARLQTSASELEELIELLIVPETWFFRDGKPFDYLKTYVTSEWLNQPNGSTLRLRSVTTEFILSPELCVGSEGLTDHRKTLKLLSVPSSTGEEPYSMAIALLEAGLLPKQFAIDAIDISQRSLAKARRGLYTKNSFRGDAWTGRSRYFQQTAEGYELCQLVKGLVNFQQGNVMTSLAIAPKQYDIIFCRNLLIYLKSEVCSQVLSALDRLLIPGGLLFVGASETGNVPDNYTSIRQPFTFAYQKSKPSLAQLAPLNITQRLDTSTSLSDHGVDPECFGRTHRPLGQVPSQLITPQTIAKQYEGVKNYSARDTQQIKASDPSASSKDLTPEPTSSLDLQKVRKLADDGRDVEAIALCKSYLVHHPTSAAAYTLLGELYQTQQNPEAERCFQRAIYLEPTCYEALVHLALLKENQGDTVGAKIIQQRIQRLQHNLKTEA
ncbi:MAG: methyltransferase domain-containing protein [Oscillatoriales cyanobacterium]|nr:MAG: methyltransferase domain-containing protein [Oscillatoriales cyanobacterium]TAH22608.1 MAG: methyltransferase domain-containing protein [Oscillatoriales cyanobacterium]